MSKLTKFQLKALRAIDEHGTVMPGEFAYLMWPDSPSWNRTYGCGSQGSCTGTGIRQAGGSYLGKLEEKGWVTFVLRTRYREFKLTSEGRRVLKEATEHLQKGD